MKELGIDVSQYDGTINWLEVKEDGVQFAILRIGYTNNSVSKRHYKDTKFDYNYEECKKLGIKVGIYYQSAATSYDDGRSDAQQVLQWMTGKSCEIGIFNQIDISKFNNNTKTQITDGIKGFCNILKANNWIAGVSSEMDILKDNINMDELSDYELWCLNFSTVKPTIIRDEYGLWRFKNEALNHKKSYNNNYLYIDYLTHSKMKGLNGYNKEFINDKENDKIEDIIDDIAHKQEIVYVPSIEKDTIEDVVAEEITIETDAEEKEQIVQNNKILEQINNINLNRKPFKLIKIIKVIKLLFNKIFNFFAIDDDIDNKNIDDK